MESKCFLAAVITLLNPKIEKAPCIDGKLIEEMFHPAGYSYHEKPTRKECGCTYRMDIGTYDSCTNGCVYCYANMNKGTAQARYQNHDKKAMFLGYAKAESDKWIEA